MLNYIAVLHCAVHYKALTRVQFSGESIAELQSITLHAELLNAVYGIVYLPMKVIVTLAVYRLLLLHRSRGCYVNTATHVKMEKKYKSPSQYRNKKNYKNC